MATPFGKRVLKWTLLSVPWLLALGLAAGWGLAVWTPGYLEKLVPEMAENMGLPLEEFHIRDAGLFSADIGPVRIGSQGNGLRLNNVRVEYTPASLRAGRVNRVLISGAVLDARFDGTTFALPILDLLKTDNSTGSKGDTGQPVPELPLEALVLHDASLRLDYQGRVLLIPFSATVTPGRDLRVEGSLSLRDQPLNFSGILGPTLDDLSLNLSARDFRLGSLTDLLPHPVTGSVDLDLKAAMNPARPETLRGAVRLTARDADPALPDFALDPATPLSLNATIADRTITLALGPVALTAPHPVTLAVPEARLTRDGLHAKLSLTSSGVTLPVSLDAQREDEHWRVALNAANPDALRMQTRGRAIRLGGLRIDCTGTASSDTADVVLEASTNRLSLEGLPVRTGRIAVRLPLAWPAPKRHTPGRLTVSTIRHESRTLGNLFAKIRQESMGIGLDGLLASELLPGLRVALAGSASMEKNTARLTFDVRKYALTEAFDPATLIPSLKEVTLTGNLMVEGAVTITEQDVDSRLGFFLTDGSAAFGEDGVRIKGIRLYFESPDLIDFRSSPAQMIAFDSLSAGPITISDGAVAFQVEPGGVVLVERGRFNWCGGHVESRSFRVVPGADDYDFVLFCSDLRLTELLQQLGLAKARGDSALSGELPVTWKNGKISFHRGFLHSTPGQGGTIQVEAMQDLLASIPKGSPQRGQLELARAAIKDYEYKWVRLKADTVGEDLLVRLSVDGKPANTLPFVYRKEFGGFAMVEGDVQGSNFQGLRLDVNFSLPMDRILLYKNLMKSIQ